MTKKPGPKRRPNKFADWFPPLKKAEPNARHQKRKAAAIKRKAKPRKANSNP